MGWVRWVKWVGWVDFVDEGRIMKDSVDSKVKKSIKITVKICKTIEKEMGRLENEEALWRTKWILGTIFEKNKK